MLKTLLFSVLSLFFLKCVLSASCPLSSNYNQYFNSMPQQVGKKIPFSFL